MRFVVIGPGAIGGVIGGRLVQHGHDVVLVARGAHYEAIRDRGLRLESPDEVSAVDVPVVDHPRRLRFGDQDVVLVATKSQDTLAALQALEAVAPPALSVVCAQNGVENERMALRRFPNVYAMCVMCPASHIEPGTVQAFSSPISGLLDIGRYPSGVDDVAEAVAGALRSSTFDSVARADVMRWKYAKLLMNLANAVEAVCGPAARDTPIIGLLRREGIACLEAAGIDFASEEEDRARRGDLLRVRPIGNQRRGGGSSWQSLRRRTGSIETDFLNGEIVLLGRLHGVATPANALLQRLANSFARQRTPPGELPADRLLAELGVPST